MYRFAKAAVNITGLVGRQVRNGSSVKQDFHSQYGTGLIAGSLVFATVVWTYAVTQTGITWNTSPVGKVMPQPWRVKEEEE